MHNLPNVYPQVVTPIFSTIESCQGKSAPRFRCQRAEVQREDMSDTQYPIHPNRTRTNTTVSSYGLFIHVAHAAAQTETCRSG